MLPKCYVNKNNKKFCKSLRILLTSCVFEIAHLWRGIPKVLPADDVASDIDCEGAFGNLVELLDEPRPFLLERKKFAAERKEDNELNDIELFQTKNFYLQYKKLMSMSLIKRIITPNH